MFGRCFRSEFIFFLTLFNFTMVVAFTALLLQHFALSNRTLFVNYLATRGGIFEAISLSYTESFGILVCLARACLRQEAWICVFSFAAVNICVLFDVYRRAFGALNQMTAHFISHKRSAHILRNALFCVVFWPTHAVFRGIFDVGSSTHQGRRPLGAFVGAVDALTLAGAAFCDERAAPLLCVLAASLRLKHGADFFFGDGSYKRNDEAVAAKEAPEYEPVHMLSPIGVAAHDLCVESGFPLTQLLWTPTESVERAFDCRLRGMLGSAKLLFRVNENHPATHQQMRSIITAKLCTWAKSAHFLTFALFACGIVVEAACYVFAVRHFAAAKDRGSQQRRLPFCVLHVAACTFTLPFAVAAKLCVNFASQRFEAEAAAYAAIETNSFEYAKMLAASLHEHRIFVCSDFLYLLVFHDAPYHAFIIDQAFKLAPFFCAKA